MTKLSSFILSVFILAMAVMPCTDVVAVNFENLTISAQFLNEPPCNDTQEDTDECTPFCICQCCGVVTTLHQVPNFDVTNHIFSASYNFHYAFHYAYDYPKGVWHPPSFC